MNGCFLKRVNQYVKERLSRTQSQVYLGYAEPMVFLGKAKNRFTDYSSP
ncbi:MAG: hypothetical protein IJD32_08450 [Bacteroidaceae bacterium]|nr:hypothetical protein [Bacteroidaceae bacterium]